MKCPACGKWNRASNPRCLYCGESLEELAGSGDKAWHDQLKDGARATEYHRMDDDGEDAGSDDHRDTLAREMAELKVRKAEGAEKQRELRESGPSQTGVANSMSFQTSQAANDFWQTAEEAPPARQRRTEKNRTDGSSRTAIEVDGEEAKHRPQWDDSRRFDPLWPEQEAYAERWQFPRTQEMTAHLPVRHRFLRKFLKVFTVLLAIGVVGLCGFFGYQYFQAQAAQRSEDHRATVIASMLDELAAHTIMIPAEEGAQIYIRELHTSYIATGGYATIEVADHTWYDNLDDVTEDTMEVTLTPFLKTASGRQQPLDVISYLIDIPSSPIELISPDGLRTVVSSAMYALEFEVRPGSKVTINGKDVSDTINAETGEFSYNANVQPIGDNVFVIRCRSQYCRESSLEIVLYREPQEIPLDLAADTYTSTSLQHMLVNCTTLPGATVDVLSPFSDLNITNLDTTGAFSFYANFDHIGDNYIRISASYPGKKTSLVEYKVYYLPSASEYTRKAWPLNEAGYAELISNINYRAEHTQVYVVIGTLQYFVSEKPQMAVFNTSEDGQSQPVLVENFTKTTWEKGQFYRIYADAYSTYSSMPWLCGRYTYTY